MSADEIFMKCVEEIRAGKTINAIQVLREHMGLGLCEAKSLVEAMARELK